MAASDPLNIHPFPILDDDPFVRLLSPVLPTPLPLPPLLPHVSSSSALPSLSLTPRTKSKLSTTNAAHGDTPVLLVGCELSYMVTEHDTARRKGLLAHGVQFCLKHAKELKLVDDVVARDADSASSATASVKIWGKVYTGMLELNRYEDVAKALEVTLQAPNGAFYSKWINEVKSVLKIKSMFFGSTDTHNHNEQKKQQQTTNVSDTKKKECYSTLFTVLGSIDVPILTTNFDTTLSVGTGLPCITLNQQSVEKIDLLLHSFPRKKNAKNNTSDVKQEQDDQPRAIIHICGTFNNPSSVCLRPELWMKQIFADSSVPHLIQHICANRDIVLVGYGIS